jgi:hypothetical protein
VKVEWKSVGVVAERGNGLEGWEIWKIYGFGGQEVCNVEVIHTRYE